MKFCFLWAIACPTHTLRRLSLSNVYGWGRLSPKENKVSLNMSTAWLFVVLTCLISLYYTPAMQAMFNEILFSLGHSLPHPYTKASSIFFWPTDKFALRDRIRKSVGFCRWWRVKGQR